MLVGGFNIQLKTDNKKLTITNAGVNGVNIQIDGSTTLNYGFNGDIETLTSDFTMSSEDFIKFVNMLDTARDQVKERLPKKVSKVTMTSDMGKAEQRTEKAAKKPKKSKK